MRKLQQLGNSRITRNRGRIAVFVGIFGLCAATLSFGTVASGRSTAHLAAPDAADTTTGLTNVYGGGNLKAADPSGGYWTTSGAGVITSHNGAPTFGSPAGMHLNQPIVGMASTPDGQGYWLVTATGTVHPYGDAKLYGSVATAGVIGIAASPDGRGYLIFTKSGKVIPKGDAHSSGAVAGGFAAVTAS